VGNAADARLWTHAYGRTNALETVPAPRLSVSAGTAGERNWVDQSFGFVMYFAEHSPMLLALLLAASVLIAGVLPAAPAPRAGLDPQKESHDQVGQTKPGDDVALVASRDHERFGEATCRVT
jgi:hypothetical protein